MASFVYHSFFEDLAEGAIDIDTDTFWVMLVGSGYTPLQTHSRRDQITSEVTNSSGSGYTAGGMVFPLTVSRTTQTTRIIPGTALWTPTLSVTPAPVRAVVYKRRGGAASADELCFCFGDGTAQASNGFEYRVVGGSPLEIVNAVGV